MYKARAIRGRRRGVTALLAMLFLVLITVLSLAMFHVAAANVQTSHNFSDLSRAQAAAESGLRWTSYRFQTMARPRELAGSITPGVAYTLWNRTGGIRDTLRQDFVTVYGVGGQPVAVDMSIADRIRVLTPIPTDIGGATYTLTVRQLTPEDFLTPSDKADARFLRVTSTGRYRNSVRSVSMDFEIEKRAKFAVVGKVPLQFGRNTLVEGPVGMTTTRNPPVLILSDLAHTHPGLKSRIQNWNTYLRGSGSVDGRMVRNHIGYDNRVSVNNAPEYRLATAAGYSDVNGDAYIDEYDLFVQTFDANRDGGITKQEFTNPSTGKMYDENLFKAIDSLSPPLINEDRNGNGQFDHGEDTNDNGKFDVERPRDGFGDEVIDNRDGYAKFRGQIMLAQDADAWQRTLSSPRKVLDNFAGTIAPEETGQQTVRFNVSQGELLDLNPENFEQAAEKFRVKTGEQPGFPARRAIGRLENLTLAASDVAYSVPYAPNSVRVLSVGGTKLTLGEVVLKTTFDAANAAARAAGKPLATSGPATFSHEETVPYGSSSWQAKYRRPVFHRVTFVNVRIPKGINALFENCVFQGVTFVEVERLITRSGGGSTTNSGDGMTWAQRMVSGSFSNNTVLTKDNSRGFQQGNNLRFHNSTFEGPVGSNYSTAYTHFANSWEFTGATIFNNKVDHTATIVAPQTNIEMGSFTDPNAAPSTLIGVVVAGNLDIRGTSVVDGSIIVTGDGAGSTTLGYFGDNDGNTDAGEMKEGGYGRLNIHYNPHRPLPDGINIAVDIKGKIATYREGSR